MSKKTASLDEVLKFCNRVRRAGGGEIIHSLMPSSPQDAGYCLLAQNLNFKCCVSPYRGAEYYQGLDIWAVNFHDLNLSLKVGKSLRLKVDRESGVVILPKKIGRVAKEFDEVKTIFEQSYYSECKNQTSVSSLNSKCQFHYTLIESNISPAERKLIQKYWRYISPTRRAKWTTPTFI